MPEPKRPLKVFLCHAHADRDPVRGLYTRLTKDGVDVWLDKAKLLPGQDWELEIRKAVREADAVVVCHSKQFNQAGFRQKEVRLALDIAMEKPEGEIFIIPARLEECDVLEKLQKWQWVDLFEEDGYEMLLRSLRAQASIEDIKNINTGYSKGINTAYPGLIIFLLDQSELMANNGKANAAMVAINKAIYEIMLQSRSGEIIKDRFYIGVIGYSKSAYPIVGGVISEIAKNPLRVESVIRKVPDGQGGSVSIKLDMPVWFEPKAEDDTPMAEAFNKTLEVVASWVEHNPRSFPPIVINITGGAPNEFDSFRGIAPVLENIASKLMQLKTDVGNLLLFNVHVAGDSASDHEIIFPTNSVYIPYSYAKFLVRISSDLPFVLLEEAQRMGLSIEPNAKGIIYDSSPKSLPEFLGFLISVAEVD